MICGGCGNAGVAAVAAVAAAAAVAAVVAMRWWQCGGNSGYDLKCCSLLIKDILKL